MKNCYQRDDIPDHLMEFFIEVEPPTSPAVILDPFAGSGTVGRVATRLGRRSILIELKPEYLAIARKRTAQRGLML